MEKDLHQKIGGAWNKRVGIRRRNGLRTEVGRNAQKKWAARGSGYVRGANSKRGKRVGRRTRTEQEAGADGFMPPGSAARAPAPASWWGSGRVH